LIERLIKLYIEAQQEGEGLWTKQLNLRKNLQLNVDQKRQFANFGEQAEKLKILPRRILELVDKTVPHTLTKIFATEGVDITLKLLSDPSSDLAELQKKGQNTYEQTNTMVEEYAK
jgi:hypothetical protein